MNPSPRAIVVDDDAAEVYRKPVCEMLKSIGYGVEETDDPEQVKSFTPGACLVLLDNYRSDAAQSYWQELLTPLRKLHPGASIVLVSHLSDEALRTDVEKLDPESRHILATDPYISYLPKGDSASLQMHLQELRSLASTLYRRLEDRKELSVLVIRAALDAAQRLRDSTVKELEEKVTVSPDKPDSYRMDTIAEGSIKDFFVPQMHLKNVVICTEEAGVHNELFHRVSSPRFFVFSDPFDGSSAFKRLCKLLHERAETGMTLESIANDAAWMDWWTKEYGFPGMNAPMVSIVLAERHSIVAAVLVNLFTKELYLSIDSGNFWKQAVEKDLANEVTAVGVAIANGGMPVGWKRFEFRDWKNLGRMGDGKLFLCTLSAVKKSKQPISEVTCHNAHAETFLGPMLRPGYDWEKSFDYRLKQGDFTPGPGRILFLAQLPALERYETTSLDSQGYACILSTGEPLTEWIGWFAFLRHATGLSAYCLRRRGEIWGHSMHRHSTNDPTSLLPDEICSIFRDGYMDLGVLHSAYAGKMRRYKDTILVAFDADDRWNKILRDKDGNDLYVRIPLFQKMNPTV